MQFIDTHIHLDDESYAPDIEQTLNRARSAGVAAIFVPGINLQSIAPIKALHQTYPNFIFPMIGLHPEDVKDDYNEVLTSMKQELEASSSYIAIGETGLDFYWSREYETQQLNAFEQQVQWAVEKQLPLMIHCRKAQQAMIPILHKYRNLLVGGVFHCFTGNEQEARELLRFPQFALGIGGVLTFKNSKLSETLKHVPLDRIVLETDGPYMAPVPHRGKRNESAYITHVIDRLVDVYQTNPEHIAEQTTTNVRRIFQHFHG